MPSFKSLFPLIVLAIVVGGAAYIGYQIYVWSGEMTERGKQHMEKKHMSYSKDGGLKVGVKEVRHEQTADKTQKTLVNVWNNAQDAKSASTSGSVSHSTPPTKRS